MIGGNMNYNMFDEIDYFTNFKGNNMNSLSDDDSLNMMKNVNLKNKNNLNYYLAHGSSGLELYQPYEGYIKGNLFENLYQGYKNYKPVKIRVNNERDEEMLNIGQMTFASHELNLYLDNYPNDTRALELFTKYRKMANDLIRNYERRYGPLTVSGEINQNTPFKWESEKWPWEV